MNKSLKNFNGFEVRLDYKETINKYAKECVEILKSTSPKGVRRNNKYADGWTVDESGRRHKDSYGATVWNQTNYQLTHLLENGHLIVNKVGGVGWASPKPHIDLAYKKVKQPFIKAMEKVDIEVNFK